jgi:hypothetical protein
MSEASQESMRTAEEPRHGGTVAQGSTQVSAQGALDDLEAWALHTVRAYLLTEHANVALTVGDLREALDAAVEQLVASGELVATGCLAGDWSELTLTAPSTGGAR